MCSKITVLTPTRGHTVGICRSRKACMKRPSCPLPHAPSARRADGACRMVLRNGPFRSAIRAVLQAISGYFRVPYILLYGIIHFLIPRTNSLYILPQIKHLTVLYATSYNQGNAHCQTQASPQMLKKSNHKKKAFSFLLDDYILHTFAA